MPFIVLNEILYIEIEKDKIRPSHTIVFHSCVTLILSCHFLLFDAVVSIQKTHAYSTLGINFKMTSVW